MAAPQAEKVADVLREQGFEVETLYEERATRQNIENYLQRLSSKAGDEDRFLLYFSGHGITQTGPLFPDICLHILLPRALLTNAVPMALLQSQYSNLKPKHMLFVLDACSPVSQSKRVGQASSRGT